MARLNLVATAKAARKTLDIVAAPAAPLLEPSDHQGEHQVIPFPKDHFITEGDLSFAGRHRIIDLWGAKGLDDRELIEKALIDAVNEAGATLLHIHLHKFEDGGGISGVAVLAESHISIHTWPEKGLATIDAFMCGDALPMKTLPVFEAAFMSERTVTAEHKRGVI